MHFLLSTILSFAGLAAALAVLIVNFLLLRRGSGWTPLLYIGISLFYGYSLLSTLIRQSSGVACALSPLRTLLVYGGLLLLHLCFLRDALKALKGETLPPAPEDPAA